MVKRLSTMRETWVPSLGREDPLEKEMAIHSSAIAWKTPWTEEPNRLQSMGLQRVGQDWVTSLSLCFTILYWFCHTLTWISHGCTWVPNPEPLSHLPRFWFFECDLFFFFLFDSYSVSVLKILFNSLLDFINATEKAAFSLKVMVLKVISFLNLAASKICV